MTFHQKFVVEWTLIILDSNVVRSTLVEYIGLNVTVPSLILYLQVEGEIDSTFMSFHRVSSCNQGLLLKDCLPGVWQNI